MLDKLENYDKVNDVLTNALELEKKGHKKEALNLLTNLVIQYPKSEAARFHMGRLASQLDEEEKNCYNDI